MSLTAAIEQAYASLPGGQRFIETVEFNSDVFVSGNPRFANNIETDTISLPPSLGGGAVDFTYVPFDFTLPENTADGPGRPKLRVNDPTGALTPYLKLASESFIPVELIYRVYVTTDLTQPGDVYDKIFVLSVTQNSDGTVEADIAFREVSQQAFPRSTYDQDRYPSLQEA